ncbi:MAG: sulfite dehydrogenase [Pseudomonadota bacterium]
MPSRGEHNDSNTELTQAKQPVAGNGLLHRRVFLQGGAVAAGALLLQRAAAEPRAPGAPLTGYGHPARHEQHVQRGHFSLQQGTVGSGASRTPLQHLQGTLTPAGLHFERHHSGVPDIHPDTHQLTVHGAVRQPLQFATEDLLRYPMASKILFLECSGNSAVNLSPQAQALSCGQIHGLISGSEWTGVPVSYVLEEAGVDPQAAWVIAEGADAARMNRSIPMAKMLDDAMIALYQNGERLRPENGYPMRLLLPGYEGNASVKWLRYLQVSPQPAMSRQETAKYTDMRSDGRAEVFTFPMEVKSVITSPSPGLQLDAPGYYEITGLAWSGRGAIRKVELSADGGASWTQAELGGPLLPQALTRFRLAWRWDGQPCTLMSRAADDYHTQPSRAALVKRWGQRFFYHYNAIQSWQVQASGQLENTYV